MFKIPYKLLKSASNCSKDTGATCEPILTQLEQLANVHIMKTITKKNSTYFFHNVP